MSQRITVFSRNGEAVPVRLNINPRAKRIILRLDPKAGEAVAVAPGKHLAKAAMAFAEEKADWIASRLNALPAAPPFAPGARIPFRGELHELSSTGIGRSTRLCESGANRILCPGAPETFGDRITRFLKRSAKHDLAEAVARHSNRLGVEARAISVKDTRSRWGSCTSDGRLSFSWRLICAPPFVLDYVAAHECAHLVEMNHSARFWALVEQSFGPHKTARAWLKRHGASLHALGAGSA